MQEGVESKPDVEGGKQAVHGAWAVVQGGRLQASRLQSQTSTLVQQEVDSKPGIGAGKRFVSPPREIVL